MTEVRATVQLRVTVKVNMILRDEASHLEHDWRNIGPVPRE